MQDRELDRDGEVQMRAKGQVERQISEGKPQGWLARWINRFRRRKRASPGKSKASPNIYPLH